MSDIKDSPRIEAATEMLMATCVRTVANTVAAWESGGMLTADQAVRIIESFEEEWGEVFDYPPGPADHQEELSMPDILARPCP
jgi:hypothetical protein